MKTEAWPCRYKSRSQRLPAGTRSWKSKGSFVPRALEVAWPCWDLGFWLTASSTVIEHISVVLSYPVCGTLYSNSRKPTQLHENIIYADYGVFWCPFQFAPQVSAFLSWPYCWLCPLIYPFATTQWGAHRGKLPISTFWYDIYMIAIPLTVFECSVGEVWTYPGYGNAQHYLCNKHQALTVSEIVLSDNKKINNLCLWGVHW